MAEMRSPVFSVGRVAAGCTVWRCTVRWSRTRWGGTFVDRLRFDHAVDEQDSLQYRLGVR
jgi:hypothetical protein